MLGVVADAHSLVEEAQAMLAPLDRSRNVAWWDANVEATDEAERRRADAELEWSNTLAAQELFDRVQRAATNGDGLVERQLELLRNLMLPHQVPESLRARIIELEASVEARFARHRGVVGGEEVDDNAIKRILRESDDSSERREAWEASKTIGPVVADDVRELARLRNEAARTLGFRDWFALSVATSEMDETRLFETLDECDRLTGAAFSTW